MTSYDNIRTAVQQEGNDTRVEVNQRALIDKILARYSTQNGVYRELLQNSNDAEAKTAEILITTKPQKASTSSSSSGSTTQKDDKRIVTQVVYRNDGHPFRSEDWSRLKNIAEGNPDVSKVGAFGVGAYTMFSICEQPLIISNSKALQFLWRGDALWARVTSIEKETSKNDKWTSFVLSSRDPYVLPNLIEFSQFLCTSLSFTQSLNKITVYVDNKQVLQIKKSTIHKPKLITPPQSTSWFSNDGMILSSPNNVFSIIHNNHQNNYAITQSTLSFHVQYLDSSHTTTSKFLSLAANVQLNNDMKRRIERVTKKLPPSVVNLYIFVNNNIETDNDSEGDNNSSNEENLAKEITNSLQPFVGQGKVFIGFKTSQTTGFAAHLAAPLIPTVEREAIDLQDGALKIYNQDMLFIAGILMRLALEHEMTMIGIDYENNKSKREEMMQKFQRKEKEKIEEKKKNHHVQQKQQPAKNKNEVNNDGGGGGIFGFVKFMTSGVRNLAGVISSNVLGNENDEYEHDVLNPIDKLPLTDDEKKAIQLMRSFSPIPSTPDLIVGTMIAKGFMSCMPSAKPLVLSKTGIIRSNQAKLPYMGIEQFVEKNVIRKKIYKNVEPYFKHVADCKHLNMNDLVEELKYRSLKDDEEFIKLLKWTIKYYSSSSNIPNVLKASLQSVVKFKILNEDNTTKIVSLNDVKYFRRDDFSSPRLPMPPSVLPLYLQKKIPTSILYDDSMHTWFRRLPFIEWAKYVVNHPSMTKGYHKDSIVRLQILKLLNKEYDNKSGLDKEQYKEWLYADLSDKKCIPFEKHVINVNDKVDDLSITADVPGDLYVRDAEIGIFEGLGTFHKVHMVLEDNGISKDFLMSIGVRKSIAIDFLFTQLDKLKWNNDPRPLIKYLRKAELNGDDLEKLKQSKYLPAVGDKSVTYSPSELYIPLQDLKIFPMLRLLQWPDELYENSAEGKFLQKLGCHTTPPLNIILTYIYETYPNLTEVQLSQYLEFICKRLGPSGVYENDFTKYAHIRFIPTVRKDPLKTKPDTKQLHSYTACYSKSGASCLGFPVFDEFLNKGMGKLFGDRFKCQEHPSSELLIQQVFHITSFAKKKTETNNVTDEERTVILKASEEIFKYLATRSFDNGQQEKLKQIAFIPVQTTTKSKNKDVNIIKWYKVNEVYFENSQTKEDAKDVMSMLFHPVKHDAFLAMVGVRSEPSPADVLKLILNSPKLVFSKVGGEKNYLHLLRRLAVSPTTNTITLEMRRSPFLLGYQMEEEIEGDTKTVTNQMEPSASESSNNDTDSNNGTPFLAKAEDISIIDNSRYARLFSVLTAPQESELEKFYGLIGSKNLSKQVRTTNNIHGNKQKGTVQTTIFMNQLNQRKPLLLSSRLTSQPLKRMGVTLLKEEDRIQAVQVDSITAEYRLGRKVKRTPVTCAAEVSERPPICTFYISSEGIDWFDVGNALGDVILSNCRLEDAFILSSILEAPLDQLRARGFPVDRILNSANKNNQSTPESNVTVQVATSNMPEKENSVTSNGDVNDGTVPGARNGFETILKQMFPQCNLESIRSKLGPNPSHDALRRAAAELADGNYQRETPSTPPVAPSIEGTSNEQKPGSGSSGLKKFINRAFRNRPTSTNNTGEQQLSMDVDHTRKVDPEEDAATANSLQGLLEKAARSSRSVSASGMTSSSHGETDNEENKTKFPRSLIDQTGGCDESSIHSIRPFPSHPIVNGVRIFYTTGDTSSSEFIAKRLPALSSFVKILRNLCNVCQISVNSVAIMHESTGNTIAFNHANALHFNLRYFVALHWSARNGHTMECYAFWLTVMCHELAHNLVAGHNKEHGMFTESYICLYMPALMRQIPSFLSSAS